MDIEGVVDEDKDLGRRSISYTHAITGQDALTEDNDGEEPISSVQDEHHSRCPKLRAFFVKHLLPISLIGGILVGVAIPWPGVEIGTQVDIGGTDISPVQTICFMIIFFISGIKLETALMYKAIQEYKGILLGILSILFLTVIIGSKLTEEVEFPQKGNGTDYLQQGLIVFYTMPTTISSGVVLTEQAEGNVALSLLLTVATNIGGVFTIPAMLEWMGGLQLGEGGEEVSLDIGSLIVKLVVIVLLPLLLGKCCRTFIKGVPAFTKRHKWALKVISIYALVVTPWITCSKAKDRGSFDDITAAQVFAVIGWAVMMHILFIIINFVMAFKLVNTPELKSVVILGSQKTLPVSVAVISVLTPDANVQGLMSISCIIAHISQIVVDSFFVGPWAEHSASQNTSPIAKDYSNAPVSAETSESKDAIITSQVDVEA